MKIIRNLEGEISDLEKERVAFEGSQGVNETEPNQEGTNT